MNDRTNALAIPTSVKKKVAERDSVDGYPCCIYCGRPAPADYPLVYSNAHYIPRAQGGLGVERNILTLCTRCHRMYDSSSNREEMRNLFRVYLKSNYKNWDEESLIYKKGK